MLCPNMTLVYKILNNKSKRMRPLKKQRSYDQLPRYLPKSGSGKDINKIWLILKIAPNSYFMEFLFEPIHKYLI